jgi:Lipocalin-like domain
MKRLTILSIAAITALGLVFLTGSALAQQTSLKEQLIGTWTFVSAVETSKDGAKSDRWGPNPKGLIIFEANGRYSFMISRSDIAKFAANNVNQGTAEENKAVVQGIIANIGTWSVDEASKTITTTIEAGSFPNLNGNSQKRIISSLTAEELKYTNPASTTGTVAEAVWRRAK